MSDTAIRILVTLLIAIMLLASGLTGKPGSIIGSLVDSNNMVEGQVGGGSSGDF